MLTTFFQEPVIKKKPQVNKEPDSDVPDPPPPKTEEPIGENNGDQKSVNEETTSNGENVPKVELGETKSDEGNNKVVVFDEKESNEEEEAKSDFIEDEAEEDRELSKMETGLLKEILEKSSKKV